jgi:hypothetical protein
MPKVMMKGCGIRNLVMPSPFTNPASMPISGDSTGTTGQGTPLAFATASVIIPSARIDPTDRSIPAVRITKNMPIDNMPLAARQFLYFLSHALDVDFQFVEMLLRHAQPRLVVGQFQSAAEYGPLGLAA